MARTARPSAGSSKSAAASRPKRRRRRDSANPKESPATSIAPDLPSPTPEDPRLGRSRETAPRVERGPPPSASAEPSPGPKSAAPLAPPTKESFDELAKRVASTEPLRTAPPDAPAPWEPDEVTLGFARVTDPSGESHELPESTVLATIWVAAESNRRGFLNRMATSFDEQIEAVANVFWPFLVVRDATGGGAAIFDGTGVWNRTFRYTELPSPETTQVALDASIVPRDHLARLREVGAAFGSAPAGELLTVEGFLPIDPPLLFDLLNESQFRTDPGLPRPAFLPARHPVGWYEEGVARMRQWLARFDEDLRSLGDFRRAAATAIDAEEERIGAELAGERSNAEAASAAASAAAGEEISRIHATHQADVQRHLDAIRDAHRAVARHEVAISTSETLAYRASRRGEDARRHREQAQQSHAAIRAAHGQIRDSHRTIRAVQDRQRLAQEEALAKVANVERASAQKLAETELFRDHYGTEASAFLRLLDRELAVRKAEREVLAGYFLPLPALASVRVVWLPVWMATLRSSHGARQLVFPPMRVRPDVGLRGTLRRLLGGIVLPVEPRTARFDNEFRRTIEAALAKDPWLASVTQELTRAADVLADPSLRANVEEGLANLRRQNWISPRQEREYARAFRSRPRRRTDRDPPREPTPPEPSADASPHAEGLSSPERDRPE